MEELLERTGTDQSGRTEPLPEFAENSAEREEKDGALCKEACGSPAEN
jgi:hypothetical protein